MICTRGDTLIHPVAADMISWAKFHLFWWSAETHYFNIQILKSPYVQKITGAKYFLKGIPVLVRRCQRQVAAVDSTVWDSGVFPDEVLMID